MWDLEGFMTLRDAAQLKKDNGIQSARLYGNVVSYQYYYIDILASRLLLPARRGIRFTDYVSLGDEFQQNPAVKVHMGCHTRETRLFVTQKARGIDSHTLLVGRQLCV
ncbi:unnamed protein product [Durusdinium trenchii]|uniref:Uncharacterized protein n=1 Tax=Durusdinium trenchii TaxID=1381693 RepID=A0ABP0PR41_9DINO